MDEKMIFMGKILGEIYRLQKHHDPDICQANDERIYGLLHGFEDSIKDELSEIGFIGEDKVSAVGDALDPYFLNQSPTPLSGFYDIKDKLEKSEVSPVDFNIIYSKLLLGGQYTSLKNNFNTNNSPVECKDFDISRIKSQI